MYWPFANRSFLSLFIVIRIRASFSAEKVALYRLGENRSLGWQYEHQPKIYKLNIGLLHWLHVMISNAKAFILGTFHGLPTGFTLTLQAWSPVYKTPCGGWLPTATLRFIKKRRLDFPHGIFRALFFCGEDVGSHIHLPRGCAEKLTTQLDSAEIPYTLCGCTHPCAGIHVL